MEDELEARVQVLERKLAGQRARARMLKAELRQARVETQWYREARDQMLKLFDSYVERNGFHRLFTLYANLQAAARMMGMTVEQFARCADHLSIAEIRVMVADLSPKRPRDD